MTIEDAIALIQRIIAPGSLNRVQEQVLRQVWEGQSYGDMAKALGYDPGYLKDTGATLWRCLSEALGEKVTKLTVRSVLERVAERQPVDGLAASPPRAIAHNLPACSAQLVGRDQELAQVMQFLDLEVGSCLSLEGLGGIGKTTLALAAAHQVRRLQSGFAAIVFVSAKPAYLSAQGILPRLTPQQNLHDLLRTIARTLDRPDILWMEFEEQIEEIRDCLQRQRTLLILDNFETVAEQPSMQAFLHELPTGVKVLLTSRQRSSFARLHLGPLAEAARLALIQQQAQCKHIELTVAAQQTLAGYTSGVPAAIVYAIGQVASGYPLAQVGHQLTLPTSEYAGFYFKSSMTHLQGSLAHHLLMALALFPGGATGTAIAQVVGGAEVAAVVAGLAQLQQLSLVQPHAERYHLLALTREYALAELATHPNFAQAAYDRWIGWSHTLAQTHGGQDAKEWQPYEALEPEWENLQAAVEWCIARDRYDDVQQFWQQIKGFTHTQGYRQNRLSVWSRRLDWTDWLIEAAQARQDWSTALSVLLDRGWTLTLLGQAHHLEQAARLYEFAWLHRQWVRDDRRSIELEINLAINIAVLKIQQQEFDRALDWPGGANRALDDAALAEATIARLIIHLLYYQGEVHYKTRRYRQAQALFQQVLHQAQQLRWQRAMFLAKDWLADIAIQQQQFAQAQQWLEEGLQMAQVHHDRCRMAFCQRSLARLAQARSNRAGAQQWAVMAQQGFEHLGMLTEAHETAAWLAALA